MKDHTELFGQGTCDRSLPANEVVEEYTFGQFVKLRYRAHNGEVRPITGMRADMKSRALLSVLGAAPLDRAVSIGALLEGNPEPAPAEIVGSAHDRVIVRDLNDLIARRLVMVDGKEAAVELEVAQIRQLLTGMPITTVARIGTRANPVTLVPTLDGSPEPARPAARRHVVSDLAAFLAAPEVPALGGGAFPLKVEASDVRTLRSEGLVTLGSGANPVTLIVAGACNPEATSTAYAARIDPNNRGLLAEVGRAPYDLSGLRPAIEEPATLPPQMPDAFTLGLYLPWTQSWRLKGYSRGSLVHSLTLAPQEETTIELFTWDRRKRSLEQSASFESDQSIEQIETTKDVMDVVRELANTSEFKIEGHAKLNVKYAAVEAEVGVAGNYTSKLNTTARRSTNHMQDSTEKAAARIRVSRQTRISESTETGSEERVTRKVRNSNMCRTLTFDYFDVLAHYTVTTAFDKDNAQVCFFVPFPDSLRNKIFTERDLRIHERALTGALLDTRLAGGFESARTLFARVWAMQHVCDRPRCADDSGAGTNSGSTGETSDAARALLEAAVERVIAAAKVLRSASVVPLARNVAVEHSAASPASALEVKRWGFWKLLERDYGSAYETLTDLAVAGTTFATPPGYPPAPPIPNIEMDDKIRMLGDLIETSPPQELKMIDIGEPNDDLKLLVQPAIVDALNALNAKDDVLDTTSSKHRSVVQEIFRRNCFDPDDAGLVAALINFQKQLNAYDNETGDGTAADAGRLAAAQRLAQMDAYADQVWSAFPLGDSAVAAERVDALVKHLNENRSHYRYALLQAMPVGDQMQELALLGMPTDLVEPRILGMVTGNSRNSDLLAVPINTALEPRWREVRNTFIDQNAALVALRAENTVRMPTPGVSVEARLGACDACEEFVLSSRGIELDQRRAQLRTQRATARQAELEAARFEARVQKGTLDDPTPDPGALHVVLDKPTT